MSRMYIYHLIACAITGLIVAILLYWFWSLYQFFRTQEYTKFSKTERYLSLGTLSYIILMLILVLLTHNSRLPWLYRNPIFYLPWQFAMVYLIALPIVQRFKETKSINLKMIIFFIAMIILLPLLSHILRARNINFYTLTIFMGYVTVIYKNPWQVFLPMIIAIGLQLFLLRKYILKRTIIYRSIAIIVIPIWIFLAISSISTSTLFIYPSIFNYQWFQPYISQKYGVNAHPDVFEPKSKPISIVKDQPTPAGLTFKYLLFGEKAIDWLSMID